MGTVDLIGRVVMHTGAMLQRNGVLPPADVKPVPIAYYPEQLKQISQILSAARTEESKKAKYPAVMLLLDMLERHVAWGTPQAMVKARAHLLLVAPTKTNTNATVLERQQLVYKPLLWPMRDQLLQSFKFVPGVSISTAELEIIDRYRMADTFNEEARRQGIQSLFNDALDGVEIRNIDLKIQVVNCYNYDE